MTDEEKNIIRQLIREEVKKLIPELFSRSLRQLREYFISNIK